MQQVDFIKIRAQKFVGTTQVCETAIGTTELLQN